MFFAIVSVEKLKELRTMNLKEAFRFQNKLTEVINAAQEYLENRDNVVDVTMLHLKSKARPEMADETLSIDKSGHAITASPNTVVEFLLNMLEEKAKLCHAIRTTKKNINMDLDGEIELNVKRQSIYRTLSQLAAIKASRTLNPNAGIGYCFNNDGNQTSFKYDIENTTTICFDRKKVKALEQKIIKEADKISKEIDKCMICEQVEYTEPFDVNVTFAELINSYENE
jgi:Fe2+ or Zn2+ uptake regulation protein